MSSDVEETDDLEILHERGEEQDHEEQTAGQEGDDDDAQDGAEAAKPVKVKRTIRNPQLKLNHETLKGPRGLVAMPELFKRQKFKGRGHEEQDLRTLLKTYEYWCHRMFPKYPFEECIEKVERLGNKKPVVVLIKKIRMGLMEEETEGRQRLSSDDEVEREPVPEPTPDTRFDDLNEQVEIVELTELQLEQIRINREVAIKRRLEKLKQIQEQAATKLTPSKSLDTQNISNLQEDSVDNTHSNVDSEETALDHQQEVADVFDSEEMMVNTPQLDASQGAQELEEVENNSSQEFAENTSQKVNDSSVKEVTTQSNILISPNESNEGNFTDNSAMDCG